MSTVLAVADYVVIAIMLAISAAIGLYFRFSGGRQKTTQEFLMADKNMSVIPVACSIMASTYSAISILGTPAETYLYGMDAIWIEISYPIGGILAVYLLLPVFYELEVSTSYEYLEKRFGKTTRYMASLLFCVQIILYMPVVIYAPSLALSTVTGLSVWTSVLSMASVCTFYSALGGLKAVLWTDLFQSILMITTMVVILIMGTLEFGGVGKVYEAAFDGHRLDISKTTTDFTERYTVWNCLAHGLVYGIYLNGTYHVQIQRLMSVKNIKRAQRSYILSIPLTFIFRLFCLLTGIVIYAYFQDCSPLKDPDVKLSSSDQIAPHFMIKIFGHLPGMTGLCIAGVFSASLSSMSSAVNGLVAVTVEDFVKPAMRNRNFKDSTAILIAKGLAIVYGILCVLMTFVIANSKKVIEVATMVLGMVGGPTLGIYILGMFTSTANETGSLIGCLIGFSMNAWMAFGTMFHKPDYPTLPLSTAGCMSNANISLAIDQMYNEESIVGLQNQNVTKIFTTANEDERYIFPLYRVSFMWFTFISCVTVIITGYISSFVIGMRKKQVIKPQYISPIVRRWICDEPNFERTYSQVPLKPKQVEQNLRSSTYEDDDL